MAEVKQLAKLKKVDLEPSDRSLLRHCFSGPQISMLRRLKKAGAQSYGIIRTHHDLAYWLDPDDIPNKGNVTPSLLLSAGHEITRETGWKFWVS